MTILAVVLAGLIPIASQDQPESKPVPNDSFRIVTAGCLKGRVFTATGRPDEPTARQGPNVTGRNFRVTGKKPVMNLVKKHQGHLVEVVGLVRKNALMDNQPGARVGNTRVVIGAPPPSSDPMGMSMRSPSGGLPVMDLSSVRFLDEGCPIEP